MPALGWRTYGRRLSWKLIAVVMGPGSRPGRRLTQLKAGATDKPWQRHLAGPYVGLSTKGDALTLTAIAELNDHADRSLLIVEDDKPFLERL